MSFPARLSALLAQMEPRHWVGLGASLALHLAILLGLRQAPPPVPEPVSFEIALEAPKPEPQARAKAKTQSRLTDAKAKPKKKLAKKPAKVKQAKREPHTLEARWRGETKPPEDAPRLDLPDARELGIDAPVEVAARPHAVASRRGAASTISPQVETEQAAAGQGLAAQAQAGKAIAGQSEPGLSEPDQAGAAVASQSGPGGEPGIALAASPTLSQGAAASGDTPGAQGAEATTGLAASGPADNAGQGPGGLASSQGSGAGINVAAGNGAQSRSSLEAPAQAGGEPQGIRLTAAGTLSEPANLPAGGGGLTAGTESAESGRATPSHARGSGASLASARAGGVSANPLPTPGKRAGGTLAERSAAGASREAPVKLAGSGGQAKTSVNPDKQLARNAAKKAGGAMSERPTSRGDASGEGMTLVAGNGRLGVATAGIDHIRIKSPGTGPGMSQSGASLALAPGEPGSSPKLAVAMRPLVAKPVSRYGGQGGGAARASDSTGVGGAYPGATLARMGGGDKDGGNRAGLALASGGGAVSARPEGAPAGTGSQVAMAGGASAQADGTATGIRQEPARLQTVKLAEVKIIRPDTQAKPLDVLAPSTFCPLPLPGHTFPINRPPKPDSADSSVPTYAQDSPSFYFPLQAMLSNIQGNAVVRVEVLPDGRPGRMWLKQSSGSAILDRDAQSQLTFWRFNPARKDGQAVSAWIDVPVIYRLQETKK